MVPRATIAVFVIALAAVVALAAPQKPRWQQLPLPPHMPRPDVRSYCKVDGGARIYYAIYGTTGDAVILLHGGLGNADHWANQVPALAADHRVVAIDSRGQGRSTRSRGTVSYDVMASDVLAVMDHLGLERASLVGWSDGGEIALKIAINHPDRVDKLFVFGSNYDAAGSKPRGNARAPTFDAYTAKCRRDYMRLSATPRQFNDLIDWLTPIWRNPMGFTKDQLRSIRAPTLIADGDHDEVIELDQVEEMAKLIPNAKLVVLADTSHFALWQDPAAFNRALVEFLATK